VYFSNDRIEVHVRQEQPLCQPSVSTNSAVVVLFKNCRGNDKVLEYYSEWEDRLPDGTDRSRTYANMNVEKENVEKEDFKGFIVQGDWSNLANVGKKLGKLGCPAFCAVDYDSESFTIRLEGGSMIRVEGINEKSGCNKWNLNVYVDMTATMRSMNEDGICTATTSLSGHLTPCNAKTEHGNYFTIAGETCRRRLEVTETILEQPVRTKMFRRLTGLSTWESFLDLTESLPEVLVGCMTEFDGSATVDYDSVHWYFKDASEKCRCRGGDIDLRCLYDYCSAFPRDEDSLREHLNDEVGEPARKGCEYVAETKAVYEANTVIKIPTPSPTVPEFLNQTPVEITVQKFNSKANCLDGVSPGETIKLNESVGCRNTKSLSFYLQCLDEAGYGAFKWELYKKPNCHRGGDETYSTAKSAEIGAQIIHNSLCDDKGLEGQGLEGDTFRYTWPEGVCDAPTPPVILDFLNQQTVTLTEYEYPTINDCNAGTRGNVKSVDEYEVGCNNTPWNSFYLSCSFIGTTQKRRFKLEYYTATNCHEGIGQKMAAKVKNTEECNDDGRTITTILWEGVCQPDVCEANPCQNNGVCTFVRGEAQRYCTCVDGWSGDNCETDVNACTANPCNNRGTCKDIAGGASDSTGRTCDCDIGFSGESCDTVCCTDLHVDCLSCSLNVTKETFCGIGPNTPGCAPTPTPEPKPDRTVGWVAATKSRQSCSDVCKNIGRKCYPPKFSEMMNDALGNVSSTQRVIDIFGEARAACSKFSQGRRNEAGPSYNAVTGVCVTRHPETFTKKCNGKKRSMIRVCPCIL